MIKLKIDKNLKKDLEQIAEDEFSTPEGVLRRGLIVYMKYLKRIDISNALKCKNSMDKVEKFIKELAEEHNASIDDIVFYCIDAYRDKVLNIGLNQRLKLSGRDEVLICIDDFYRGKMIGLYNKEENPQGKLTELLKLKAEEYKIERMEELELYITNAKIKLKKVEGEYEQLKKDCKAANIEYTKITGEYTALKALSIIKLTAKQRLEHKAKLESKRGEFYDISSKTTILEARLESKKSELLETQQDIGYMISCKEKEEIPSSAFIGKYSPTKEGVINEE